MTEVQFKELQELLQRVESSTGLEALAVVTREGIRLACAVSGDVDSDIFSAATATLVSVGEENLRQLGQGILSEIILRGSKGFTIIMKGSEETLLVGASRDQIRLGYYIGIMKIYAGQVKKLMEEHPLKTDQLLGVRKEPEVETAATPTPSEASSPTPQPTAATAAASETSEVSVDDKEAILVALKALGFDEQE
jgi:predicted regulator of Ras-like GTPase activity (Roadblock/LC7/MglB family)